VIPHIGKRKLQDIDGAVLDALYAKLLAEGRRKADNNSRMYEHWLAHKDAGPADLVKACGVTIHAARSALTRYRAGRVPQAHAHGLAPKTVVNAHRMLHRAWEDFETWKWVHRNAAKNAHPPSIPRQGRKVWNVAQLRTFLDGARHDRFYPLWVLEATSGMRRCELAGVSRDGLDLDAATLAIEVTRVVINGRVVESDGKTENAQRVLALDPFTLAALSRLVQQLDAERADLGTDYQDHGLLFCWENGSRRTPTPSPAVSSGYPRERACQTSICTTCATATPPRAVTRRSTGRRLVCGSVTRTWPSP
jgi:integrase